MNYIYIITCMVNKKVYIGKTTDFKRRVACHKSKLRHKIHHNKSLQSDWEYFGEKEFTFGILEENIIEKELDDKEKYWIKYYNSMSKDTGYNTYLGQTKPIETRKNLSNKLKGRFMVYDTKSNKVINTHPFLGKHHTESSKQKIRESQLGKVPSQETRIKISNAQKGRKPTKGNTGVFKFNFNNEQIIDIFLRRINSESLDSIGETYGCGEKPIRRVLLTYAEMIKAILVEHREEIK